VARWFLAGSSIEDELADAVASDNPELGRVNAYATADDLTLATVAGGRCVRAVLLRDGRVEAGGCSN
jgi:hypothetical protein